MTLQEYNHYYSQPIIKHMALTFNDLSDPDDSDIVLTNSDICSEQMSLEESLCSGSEDLNFGACEASCFRIRVVNSGSFKGKTVVVSQSFTDKEGRLVTHTGDYVVDHLGRYIIVLTANGETVNVPCGTYKVFSDKPSNDRVWRDLVCYDAMYDILNADVKDWYEALTFPMTIKNLRDSFFTYLGITQVTTTLVNDSLSILGGFVAEGELSGKTIIESICQLNGVFGHINREGKMDYISLPNADSLEYEWYVDGTGAYEDYVTSSITKIIARKENNDVGTQVGTDGNTWVIENNPLIYGIEGTQALTTALTNLLQMVSTITYRPFQVTTYGLPMLPLGTKIQLNTRDQTINSIVMNRTLNGIQGMTDEISATGNKDRASTINSFNSQIQRTKGKVHLLEVDLDTFKSEVSNTFENVEGEIEANTTLINQTADAIELEVKGVRSRTENNIYANYWNIDTSTTPNKLVINCIISLENGDTLNNRHFVMNLPTKLPRGSGSASAVDFYPFTTHKDKPKVLDVTITSSSGSIALGQIPIYYNGDIPLTDQGTDGSTLHFSYFYNKDFPVTGSDPQVYSQFTGFWVGADDSYNQAVTARSEIAMTNTQIVMKVEASTGKMVLVQLGLGADDQSATEFKVEADNINLSANDVFNIMSGGDLNLSAKNMTISADGLEISSSGDMSLSKSGRPADDVPEYTIADAVTSSTERAVHLRINTTDTLYDGYRFNLIVPSAYVQYFTNNTYKTYRKILGIYANSSATTMRANCNLYYEEDLTHEITDQFSDIEANGRITLNFYVYNPGGGASTVFYDPDDYYFKVIDGRMEVALDNLKIDSSGALTCSDLTVNGGSINIAGSNYSFKVNATGTMEVNMQNLQIDSTGAITCTGVDINGGDINIGNGVFHVTNTGALSCSSATITGGSIKLTGTSTITKIAADSFSVASASNSNIYTSFGAGSITLRSSSPTSGYIKSNLLDDGLHLYDASSIMRGSLYMFMSGSPAPSEWRSNGNTYLDLTGDIYNSNGWGYSQQTLKGFLDIARVKYCGTASSTPVSFVLEDNVTVNPTVRPLVSTGGSFLVIVTHNSSSDLNGVWLVNGTGGTAFRLSSTGGNVTITSGLEPLGATKITVNTSGNTTVRVHALKLPQA